jgi:hypothetical protein
LVPEVLKSGEFFTVLVVGVPPEASFNYDIFIPTTIPELIHCNV